MKPKQGMQAKILNHDSGLGVPTADTVRERAMEIARINGHEEVTPADWLEAKRELHGGHELSTTDGETQMVESAHDWSVGSIGHRIERRFDDTENVVEELIAEGMDEAVHEQMLEASRNGVEEELEEQPEAT